MGIFGFLTRKPLLAFGLGLVVTAGILILGKSQISHETSLLAADQIPETSSSNAAQKKVAHNTEEAFQEAANKRFIDRHIINDIMA